MNIQVLGAHNCESQDSKFVSLLVDDVLAIDAGGLTSSLSFSAQQKLKAILLTHRHYDHIRDIPAIAMNLYLRNASITVYSTQPVYDALVTHLLDGNLYPNFLEQPPENPTIRFNIVKPRQTIKLEEYSIVAIPVNHTGQAVGYQVTSPDGKTMFYTGDTGPDLTDCWKLVSPQLLIIEVIAPNRYEDFAREVGHLTPDLLKQELTTFQKIKGYLPQVVTVHMNPDLEKEIEAEIVDVNATLNNAITLAHEGMKLQV